MQMMLYQARQYGKMNHINSGQHKGSDKEDDGSYLACELKASTPTGYYTGARTLFTVA